jgi:hypothetical protein
MWGYIQIHYIAKTMLCVGYIASYLQFNLLVVLQLLFFLSHLCCFED